MADPLSLLREFVSTGKVHEVVLAGDRVDFGGKFSFSKNVATGYKSQQGKGKLYDLETLLFFSKHINEKFTEYFKKAGKEIGKQVTFLDRMDLQNYLTGKSDRSEYIQLTVPDFEVGQPAKRARLEAGGEAEAGPAAEAVEEGAEDAALRRIRESELQLRDRNSMLSVPGRSFGKVGTILTQAQLEQQHKMQQQEEHHKQAKRKHQAAAQPVIPVRPSGRYERQTQQDATLKQMGAAELGVQVGFKPATAAAAAAGSLAVAAQQGAPPPPPPAAAAPRPPSQQQQQQQRQPRPGGGGGSRAQPQQPRQAQKQRAAPRHGTPIIMVPPGMTSLLNMYNVRPFLEEGRFCTTDEAKAEMAKTKDGVKKEERAAIQRTIARKAPVKYWVTDKEPAHKQDWDRVVAVICLGKAWQFKKWPFKGAQSGDLVEAFSRVLGVYVHYTDEAVDATVRSWNVKVLGINRQSRHRDATVAQEFWRMLDAHLQARSSQLLY
ncbi:hypothetical protein CHLNCDRAFT_56751 [Chlorella variabilis]|uniref:Cell division control protein 73 C-terminal domain-containing protein n=1 Tax=Chlorella variabilis TaxID=554065 RepID=E1Z4Z1_CHLVA|nr:hypothetical protein CHLNCDRAFT_56751 [Chlorella variabilis]EFN59429.1 hypothetical protein CHLNCDRAFT_56751 [Chlorella variabilis]|eukprot:XP_005851531.1 hypothetical protein CHLNCDRAFT_56751 [Chlorella variabilis]